VFARTHMHVVHLHAGVRLLSQWHRGWSDATVQQDAESVINPSNRRVVGARPSCAFFSQLHSDLVYLVTTSRC